MYPNTLFFSALLLFTLVSWSCNDDAATADQLLGKWSITAAERDKKPTETLNGMYFDFASGEQLLSNISGEDAQYTYEVAAGEILQRGGVIEADYNIEELTDTQLILTTVIRGKPFRLVFARDAAQK
jgi:hypothetical protein